VLGVYLWYQERLRLSWKVEECKPLLLGLQWNPEADLRILALPFELRVLEAGAYTRSLFTST